MHRKLIMRVHICVLPDVFVGSSPVGSLPLIFTETVTPFDLWIHVKSLVSSVSAVDPEVLLSAYQLTLLCPSCNSLCTQSSGPNGFPEVYNIGALLSPAMMNDQFIIKSQ